MEPRVSAKGADVIQGQVCSPCYVTRTVPNPMATVMTEAERVCLTKLAQHRKGKGF